MAVVLQQQCGKRKLRFLGTGVCFFSDNVGIEGRRIRKWGCCGGGWGCW